MERFFILKGEMKMEVKQTLLMPKTSFEMRGNLPSKEPKYREKWENEYY